jgi:N-acetylmuramoyl-L-alanine amidase
MRVERGMRALVLAMTCGSLLLLACGAPDRPPAPVAAPASSPSATATATTALATPTSEAAGVSSPAPRDTPRVAAPPRAAGDRTRIVVLDPGHAADEIGAAANGVVEKQSNLDMALRVEAVLRTQGVRVVLTRRTDERAYVGPEVQGYSATRRDLQARIDLANDVGADVFVSLHSNGAASSEERGVETYWDSSRPFADANRELASMIQSSVVAAMANAGTAVADRGAKDDVCLRVFRDRCFPLFVLGSARVTSRDEVLQRGGAPDALGFGPAQVATSSRATLMPGALAELLFVSSPDDAAMLRSESARDTLARGVARGILEYLNAHPIAAG